MSKKSVWIVFGAVSAVLLALDLWLKYWAAVNLPGEPRFLVYGIIELRYTRNFGAAFSLFADFPFARVFLSILKYAILAGVLWYYHHLPLEKKFWLMRVPLILIFAGGLGNFLDRAVLGYVRDMLRFYFIPRFAIFNLADVYVVTGVLVLLFVGLFIIKDFPMLIDKKEEKK